ncbi:hypothetical protein KSB_38580 [Ktedonobacter robiniae]|uniref:Uncharacterized protein n=1 Tax=Ktedonobacter robiniae TaxID=2778365 RepID=A0ABQ3URQ2_9CHLR|nr:hypothetical protein KSB_38580 [Ktedonobacter robiniae]
MQFITHGSGEGLVPFYYTYNLTKAYTDMHMIFETAMCQDRVCLESAWGSRVWPAMYPVDKTVFLSC